MQITITSTDDLTTLDGVPVRRWVGRTAGGIPCQVFVHRVQVLEGKHQSFEAELTEQPAPQRTLHGPSADAPPFADYLAAMQRHGTHPVQLDTTVTELMVIISTLQLALRHPNFSPRVREQVEGFLTPAIAALQQIDPLMGAVGRLGNDPAKGVPTLPEDTHG